MRSATLNGPLIPLKQAGKHRGGKSKKNVVVCDHHGKGSNQGSSPCRRKNSTSPQTYKVLSVFSKDPATFDDALKSNYGFDDLMLDQTQIMIGGHDIKQVAKLARQRL